MEVFSFSKSKWETIKPMHKARDGVGVSSYDGRIYAAGGKGIIFLFLLSYIFHANGYKANYNVTKISLTRFRLY